MNSEEPNEKDDVQPEYDFRDGTRGKHYEAYQEGHVLRVVQTDGAIAEQHFRIEEGAVLLEPDAR